MPLRQEQVFTVEDPTLSPEVIRAIAIDIAAERPIEESELEYTPSMRAQRKRMELRFEAFLEDNPGAIFEIPAELEVDTEDD